MASNCSHGAGWPSQGDAMDAACARPAATSQTKVRTGGNALKAKAKVLNGTLKVTMRVKTGDYGVCYGIKPLQLTA
jgi:hypothetical protein